LLSLRNNCRCYRSCIINQAWDFSHYFVPGPCVFCIGLICFMCRWFYTNLGLLHLCYQASGKINRETTYHRRGNKLRRGCNRRDIGNFWGRIQWKFWFHRSRRRLDIRREMVLKDNPNESGAKRWQNEECEVDRKQL